MLSTLPSPVPLEQPAGELIPQHTAREMARVYREGIERIQELGREIAAQTKIMANAFEVQDGEDDIYRPGMFSLDFEFSGNRERVDSLERILVEFKRSAWRVLINRLGVINIMSVKKRNEFEEQLRRGELPEISEGTIIGILAGLCEQAKDFAREAALEVFDILRPRGHWGGQYKTNNAFRVGRKVILGWMVEQGYGGHRFRVNHNREQQLTAIDGIFHLLDGQGIMRENRGPLVRSINGSPTGQGETEYFRFKCFNNRNLHLELKRLDLVQELNLLATGERVLGQDME